MKLSQFLCIVACITILSLLYVYQQTEILRLAYIGQKKSSLLEDLVDKNSLSRYNIEKSASLVQIADAIHRPCDFQIPDTYKLVRLTTSQGKPETSESPLYRESVLSRLFGVKREAQAKTTNP